MFFVFCFFKQKTAYEMRISDWSSDVCSSDLESEEFPERTEEDQARVVVHRRRNAQRGIEIGEGFVDQQPAGSAPAREQLAEHRGRDDPAVGIDPDLLDLETGAAIERAVEIGRAHV